MVIRLLPCIKWVPPLPPPQPAKEQGRKMSKTFYLIYGRSAMSAQMLQMLQMLQMVEVSRNGASSVSEGMRGQWYGQMTKASNIRVAPPSAPRPHAALAFVLSLYQKGNRVMLLVMLIH